MRPRFKVKSKVHRIADKIRDWARTPDALLAGFLLFLCVYLWSIK